MRRNTDYEFSLVVTDANSQASAADTVTVTVAATSPGLGNRAPTANAGPDQTVGEGTTVTLDGTGSSDPDSDSFTYAWTAPEGVSLSSTTVGQPTFTTATELLANQNLVFSLTVTDEWNEASTAGHGDDHGDGGAE